MQSVIYDSCMLYEKVVMHFPVADTNLQRPHQYPLSLGLLYQYQSFSTVLFKY